MKMETTGITTTVPTGNAESPPNHPSGNSDKIWQCERNRGTRMEDANRTIRAPHPGTRIPNLDIAMYTMHKEDTAHKLHVNINTHAPYARDHTQHTDTPTHTSPTQGMEKGPHIPTHNAHNTKHMPTPINPDVLDSMLKDYKDRKYIVDGFREGFSLGFEGPRTPLTSNNSHTITDKTHLAQTKIDNEVRLGRIEGPFDQPPWPNMKFSPLALREKSTPGTYRLLHNLSYPYDHNAVNINIAQENKTVHYSTIRDAAKLLNSIPHPHMAKSDIKDAFRLIPLDPRDYHLTGIKLNGKYYYDKCMPMGASSSCNIFEKFSDALVYILNTHYGESNVVKILDDFLFIGDTEESCNRALDSFISLTTLIGVPLSDDKTVRATKVIQFLGITLDSTKMEASLPIGKVNKYGKDVEMLMNQTHTTFRAFRSVIGKLQFSTCIISAGHCFLRRMYNAMIGKKKWAKIIISESIKEDLRIWSSFLKQHNGKTIIHREKPLSSPELHLYTDSSVHGYGGTCGTKYIMGVFPPTWRKYGIQFLEMYPIYLLTNIFATTLANRHIKFHCDNEAVVHIINKQSTPKKTIMVLVRNMVLVFLKYNITFKAVHIPGKDNQLTDALSRQKATPAMLLEKGMEIHPTKIPEYLTTIKFWN